jgi:hypothetical protein
MWEPRRLTTLWFFTASYRVSLTFTLLNHHVNNKIMEVRAGNVTLKCTNNNCKNFKETRRVYWLEWNEIIFVIFPDPWRQMLGKFLKLGNNRLFPQFQIICHYHPVIWRHIVRVTDSVICSYQKIHVKTDMEDQGRNWRRYPKQFHVHHYVIRMKCKSEYHLLINSRSML